MRKNLKNKIKIKHTRIISTTLIFNNRNINAPITRDPGMRMGYGGPAGNLDLLDPK